MTDLEEYIAGTQPTNPASFLTIEPSLAFQSQRGRIYQLEACIGLPSNEWEFVQDAVPGTGNIIEFPSAPVEAAAFYRLQVEKP